MKLRDSLLSLLILSVICFVMFACRLAWDLDQAAHKIPDALRELSASLEQSTNWVQSDLSVTESDAMARADRLVAVLSKAEADLNGQLTAANSTLDQAGQALDRSALQIGNAAQELGNTGAQIGNSAQELSKLREDVQPSIQGVNLLMQRNALPAEILGTLGAAKVTAGETAQTMKSVRDAMPTILDGVHQVVENSDRATAASATAAEQTTKVMQNFATASKPLPLPLRVFLQVAPPLAGFAAGAATTYSVTH